MTADMKQRLSARKKDTHIKIFSNGYSFIVLCYPRVIFTFLAQLVHVERHSHVCVVRLDTLLDGVVVVHSKLGSTSDNADNPIGKVSFCSGGGYKFPIFM